MRDWKNPSSLSSKLLKKRYWALKSLVDFVPPGLRGKGYSISTIFFEILANARRSSLNEVEFLDCIRLENIFDARGPF